MHASTHPIDPLTGLARTGALIRALDTLDAPRDPCRDAPYGLIVVSVNGSRLSTDLSTRGDAATIAEVGRGLCCAWPGAAFRIGRTVADPTAGATRSGPRPTSEDRGGIDVAEPQFALLVDAVAPAGLGQANRELLRSIDPSVRASVVTTHRASWTVAGDHPIRGAELLCETMRLAIIEQIMPFSHRLARLETVFLDSTGRSFDETLDLEHRLQRAEAAAQRDPATGLLNRRGYEAALVSLQGPYALAFVDLDDLRLLNATPGLHWEAGDQGIFGIARLLAGRDPRDLVVRWGGDEFLVLFPGLDEGRAAAELERLLDQCRDSLIIGGRPVSFSAGVAAIGPGGAHAAAVEAAQSAVKAAKQTKGVVIRAAAMSGRRT